MSEYADFEIHSLGPNRSAYITDDPPISFSYYGFDTSSLRTVESGVLNNFTEEANELLIKLKERHVFELISEGKYQDVKKYLDDLDDVSSPLLKKWKNAFCREIKKRTWKASLTKDDIKNDSELIEFYKEKYSSHWIAIKSGVLIDANKNLESLRKAISQFGNLEKVTFLKL